MKSSGSEAPLEDGALDTRIIHAIEEVRLPPKRKRMPPVTGGIFSSVASGSQDESSKTSSAERSRRENEDRVTQRKEQIREGSNNDDAEDKESTTTAEDAANVHHLHDHHPRAMEPGATYLRPLDLKQFATLLGTDDWEDVHRRVILLGQERSKHIRERLAAKKADLDSVGIFLPGANKLRTDAQMQVQLRRALQYEELERAVLTEMLVRERLNSASSAERDAAELQASFQNARRNKPPSLGKSSTKRNVAGPKIGGKLNGSRKPRIARQGTTIARDLHRKKMLAHFNELDRKEREEAGLPPPSPPADETNSIPEHDDEGLGAGKSRPSIQGGRRRRKRTTKRQSAILDGAAMIDCALLQQLRGIFEMLEVPPGLQMEMMIKYSDPAAALDFVDVVADWERVGRIVVLHEKVVKVVLLARERRVEASGAFTDDETEALEALGCYVSMAQMFGASCATWALAILDKISLVCERAVQELEDTWNDKLSFRGHLYLKTRFPAAPNAPIDGTYATEDPEGTKAREAGEDNEADDFNDVDLSDDDASISASQLAQEVKACNGTDTREGVLKEIRYGGNRQIVRLNPLLLKD
ncbi:Hypothetical Protein FCC1311_038882 [Hondaea fermentalgiana]|uniref:Uncharacterized protein n=1 Tax=Hondaea fermentalgiana TaxID=2315210 RepID=A0A2R5GAP5_9STRA|nr:Hypothetical Protein FCC1311_038882 [Hondaea fermentalgiana]|eukprot:GBG27665.1 Hypothetical Protein FCC1311_038882 [Hondaea fermentalgiana]